jgi:hypothetical protein
MSSLGWKWRRLRAMSAQERTTHLLLHRLLSDTVFEPVAQLWGLAHRPHAPRLYGNSAAPDVSWGLYHICLQSLAGDCQPAVDIAPLSCSYRLHAISDFGNPNHHSTTISASGKSVRISRTVRRFQSGAVDLIQNLFIKFIKRINNGRGSRSKQTGIHV